MNLRETILEKHSKPQMEKIVKWVGKSQARFDELFELFLNDEYRVTQRASWPLSYCAQKHPEFIKKHFGKLFRNLKKPSLHDSIKRNTMRILQDVDIPKRYHGEALNTCFAFIESPTEAAAIKAFSISTLERLLPLYPDIKNELKLIIEERWEHETPAFHVRAKRILQLL